MSATGSGRHTPKIFTFSDSHIKKHAQRRLEENPFDTYAFSKVSVELQRKTLAVCFGARHPEDLKNLRCLLESPAIYNNKPEFEFFFKAISKNSTHYSEEAMGVLRDFLSHPSHPAFLGVRAEAGGKPPEDMYPPAFQTLFRLAFDESMQRKPGQSRDGGPSASN